MNRVNFLAYGIRSLVCLLFYILGAILLIYAWFGQNFDKVTLVITEWKVQAAFASGLLCVILTLVTILMTYVWMIFGATSEKTWLFEDYIVSIKSNSAVK